ncbi:hypothetical protein [Pedobacter miscanthi]|jgi:hypothetical protein|nr:hypothetical protein [Pedobacter miscanthi]
MKNKAVAQILQLVLKPKNIIERQKIRGKEKSVNNFIFIGFTT